jgi:hypothetical protein
MSADQKESASLPVVRVGDIRIETTRRWMIEGLWGASAVGLIGGAPKCCKSWLGLDLAVSVASGTPALGLFRVHEVGPALIYLAEDALAVVRERVENIVSHRCLDLRTILVHVITVPSLRLDRQADRDRLFQTAARLRPRLLLLDPLVRLHGLNENDASEVSELLSYIRDLQRNLDLSVILVHHTRKNSPAGSQAGQGLRGSGDLHAFGDSNLYLRRLKGSLLLSMEHRAAAAPDPVVLELTTKNPKGIHLEVVGKPEEMRTRSFEEEILGLLSKKPAVTRGELREALAIKNEKLGKVLEDLQARGKIDRCREGWRIAPTNGVPRSLI